MMSISAREMASRAASMVSLVQGLLIEHHIWLDDPAAYRALGHRALIIKIQVIKPAALHAVIAVDRAVELIYRFTARRLMEAVDVLGDHRLQLTRPSSSASFQWAALGWHRERASSAVKAVELLRVPLKKRVAQNGLRRIGYC